MCNSDRTKESLKHTGHCNMPKTNSKVHRDTTEFTVHGSVLAAGKWDMALTLLSELTLKLRDMIHICKYYSTCYYDFLYMKPEAKASREESMACTWDYYDHEKQTSPRLRSRKKRTMPVWAITISSLHMEPKIKKVFNKYTLNK